MKDASWALQKSVYEALAADANLAARVSGVFDAVPEDTAFPYVTLGEMTAADWSAKTFFGQAHTLTLHTWSRARGAKETKEIMALVHEALDNANLSLPGHELVILRFDFAQTLNDPDGLTRHGIQRFRALTRAKP